VGGLLQGYRVLDCTDERGLLAGRMLADLGADVVAVEPPGGSTARTVPPRLDSSHLGPSHRGSESMLWAAYAANKRGITCDFGSAVDRQRLLDLVAVADFFIESADPGTLEGVGLGYEDLRRVNPALVHVSITAFGQSGPKANWAATDLIVWAAGGPLAYNQDGSRPPLRISTPQAYLHASADAAAGALLAHEARKRTGLGQHVDVSAQAALGLATLAMVLTAATGDAEPEWLPRPGSTVTIDNSGSGSRTRRSKWRVKDGYVELHLAMGPAAGAFTNSFMSWVLEAGRLDPVAAAWDWRLLPEAIKRGDVTGADMERVRDAVASFFETKTKQEVTDAAVARKVLSVGVADVSDLAASPHFADRGYFVTVGEGERGRTLPGPFAAASVDAFVHRRPAPLIGEHDDEVVVEWARPSPVTGPGGGRPMRRVPLEGLKVADFSWVVAGPVIGRALADFGATVVRVESSSRIETARHMSPFYGGKPGVEASALYQTTNVGKLGLGLDLTTAAGREVALDLIRWADVVIESFTPGLMQRWGLDYESVRIDNPDLIMLSTSLMGHSGRYSALAGYGNVGAAMSGFQSIVGWPDLPPLGPFGPYTDYIAPRFALVALLSAVDRWERTGAGCYLDVSQAECGAWFLAPEIADYVAQGRILERQGNRDAAFAPHGVFPCSPAAPGRADYVAIACRHDDDFRALTAELGRPELALDPRFATVEARRTDADHLEAIIAAWTSTRPASEIEAGLQAVGVPAHRAAKSADFLADEQLSHRHHLHTLPHAEFGEVVVEGPRYLLSDTPGLVERTAPAIGQDTDAVLADLLGYTPERIETQRRAGALH
jgi:crotonobetainyl-CoA:carnitine CoA-transferase CaiB-like acyl-CoA transferase